ncbi:hypothetical protein HPP92_004598 [Vanilla planifolia]|uniref:Generative cell specific-1/HAP2 domain-containing protein n=1 Tax=Vanilla planifolia TaxID=51239 RepID=A0A835RQM9_VANPL|nr:hypothetical protein HPP92_004598 [Vanilla planifolia]
MAVEILSKSKLERCAKTSESGDLSCEKKVVINMVVPSGSTGGEASIVAELVEVEENDTQKMQAIRVPPIITINKSAAYALYELSYLRDVAFKPEEFYIKTRKCEPDASSRIVKICESPFAALVVQNVACLLPVGISEVVLGPENRTALSKDNFLRVNLIGDFIGYTSIPSFEDFYLVTPRLGEVGHSENLGKNFTKWMLLERVRFTLDGLECNKIGVGYEAYRSQPNFCSSPLWSCLHNQLWHFWEADKNRMSRNQPPQYIIEGKYERINQHPNAGTHSFSVGVTEVLNTNLLIELSADDIEYVYQRSPGKILSINVPTFEALTQFGTAKVSTKNIGKLEASYSLTFDCLKGVNYMEEQFYIMKPDEIVSRSFHLYPTTDQAGKYECAAILKDSDFTEVDHAECQFATTATVLDNGSQIMYEYEVKDGGLNGFLAAIKNGWRRIWDGLVDFLTGKSCRGRCSSFFDLNCHLRYVCMSWILLFGLLLAIFPCAIILLWLLHQKGFLDPIYDLWDERFGSETQRTIIPLKHEKVKKQSQFSHHHRNHHKKNRLNNDDIRRSSKPRNHGHGGFLVHSHPSSSVMTDHHRHHKHDNHLHVHKERHKHMHDNLIKHGSTLEDTKDSRELLHAGKHHEMKQTTRKHAHGHGQASGKDHRSKHRYHDRDYWH